MYCVNDFQLSGILPIQINVMELNSIDITVARLILHYNVISHLIIHKRKTNTLTLSIMTIIFVIFDNNQ